MAGSNVNHLLIKHMQSDIHTSPYLRQCEIPFARDKPQARPGRIVASHVRNPLRTNQPF